MFLQDSQGVGIIEWWPVATKIMFHCSSMPHTYVCAHYKMFIIMMATTSLILAFQHCACMEMRLSYDCIERVCVVKSRVYNGESAVYIVKVKTSASRFDIILY